MHTVTLLLVVSSWTASAPPITVGTARQLVLDDHLIASQLNVSRQIHPARKHPANPVLEPTEPWEGDTAILFGSAIRDGDRYRMWYYAGGNVGYAESEDGLRWRKPNLGVIAHQGRDTNLVVRRDEADGSPPTLPYLLENFGEIYSMMVFPYEGVYIGLVQMFHKERDTCRLELQLAVSRDTRHFTRVGDRAPFIPVGPTGSWDQYNNSIATGPPLEVGDELWFYYGGRSSPHSPYQAAGAAKRGCIGLATIPRDRFASLSAGEQPGQILTKPLRLDGRMLHLNADASAGHMVIDMLDTTGNVVARSSRITRDSLDIPVEWETGGLEAATPPVTLRIQMQQAELFALWCSPR